LNEWAFVGFKAESVDKLVKSGSLGAGWVAIPYPLG
jgi:hypothetical protein